MFNAASVRSAHKWRAVFETSSTIAMVGLAAILVWQGPARFSNAPAERSGITIAVPQNPIPLAARPTLGKATAKVAIVEYSDFQCPYCGIVARDTLPAIVSEYVETGKVILVFKNLPFPTHQFAAGAAAAALCAGEQGKFWEMHDQLFGLPSKLSDAEMRVSAGKLGLNLSLYESCRTTNAMAKLVEADISEAAALKIQATPTFLFGTVVNGHVRATDVVSGSRPIVAFKKILDRLMNE